MPDRTPSLLTLARAAFPGLSRGTLVLRARYLAAAWRHRAAAQAVAAAPQGSALRRIMDERPQLLGALVWPYQCASWDAAENLARIRAHYALVDEIGPPLDFPSDARLVLCDLGAWREDVRIVLDQPTWVLREGGFAINIFVGDFRAFSIAFSLVRDAGGGRVAVIGGIQGRNREDALDLYRELTRSFFGMRPRDLLLEVFRMFCRRIGVSSIHAVSDRARFHNHPFFRGQAPVSASYDEIWRDRQAERLDDDFFALSVAPDRRPLDEVKPNKRSLYRARYAFLDAVEAALAGAFATLRPVRFADS
jgi:uncharacterized protein VirK/YbjX